MCRCEINPEIEENYKNISWLELLGLKKINKKIFIFIFLIFVLINFSKADCSYLNNASAYFSYDSDINDISGNGYTGTNTDTTEITGILLNARDFEGTTSYIDYSTSNILPTGTNPFTVNLWLNMQKSFNDGDYNIIALLRQDTQFFSDVVRTGTDYFINFGFRGTNQVVKYTISYPDFYQDWNMITFIYTGGAKNSLSSYNLYINGNLYTTGKTLVSIGGSGTSNIFGKDNGASGYLEGYIDEFSIYNYTLNTVDLSNLHNSGLACNPYIVTPSELTNSTTERVIEIEQATSQVEIISSQNYTEIVTGSFNSTTPSVSYLTFTNNVYFTTADVNVTCGTNLDGNFYDSAIELYSPGAMQLRSFAYVSNLFNLTPGNHNFSFECKGDNLDMFFIANSRVTLHRLIDQFNNTINYNVTSFDKNINSENFTQVDFNALPFGFLPFQTKNQTLSSGYKTNFVIDMSTVSTFTNNTNISYYLKVVAKDLTESYNCSVFSNSGGNAIKTTSGDSCILLNMTPAKIYNVYLYAKGEGTLSGNILIKEITTLESMIKTVSIEDYNLTSLDYVDITSIFVNTTEEIFNTAHFTIENQKTDNTAIQFRFLVNGIETIEHYHIFNTGYQYMPLSISMQDVLMDLTPSQIYNLTFQARLINYTANPEILIKSLDFTGFIVDQKELLINSFIINIYNDNTNEVLSNFTVYNGDTTYLTQGDTVTISTTQLTKNLIIEKFGYANRTILNHDTTVDLNVSMFPFGINYYIYSGNVTQSTFNYVRNLNLTLNYTCKDGASANLLRFVNGLYAGKYPLSCDNNANEFKTNYTHVTEGLYNITFQINTSYFPELINENISIETFRSDLNNPTVYVLFNLSNGFGETAANLTLRCVDSQWLGNIFYNLTFNSIELYSGNNVNNTLIQENAMGIDGINVATGYCSDYFGTSTASYSQTIYLKELCIINERTGNLFDVSNITGVKVFYDDNRSFYDFKLNNQSCINFTTLNSDKLRFELDYLTELITRYIDVSLIDDDEIRVCSNVQGTQYYEQFLISSTQTPVILKSVYSDCLIAGDYTRFAYQNSLALKVYSINTLYYLYTFDSEGNQILLASVDGSIADYYNLDTLEFNKQSVSINVKSDSLTFEKDKNTVDQMIIYYRNDADDNEEATLYLYRMDTQELLLETDDFSNPNEFTTYFNYGTLADINSTTLFKIQLDLVKEDGTEKILYKYFNTNIKTGIINSKVAFIIGLLLLIFGLSFTISQISFSWFGVLTTFSSVALLSLAAPAWYITFLMALDIIVLVYIIFTMFGKNQSTLA